VPAIRAAREAGLFDGWMAGPVKNMRQVVILSESVRQVEDPGC
jgi:hypothetical protein